MTAASSKNAQQEQYNAIRHRMTDTTTTLNRVEVNQRALIDKILARYASAGAVYRELLQNSNDAEATQAQILFTTTTTKPIVVTQVVYRNNGMDFRPQDWSRLQKIAEGNPDVSKVGAFGVGAYTMFSICEEPLILSGSQALAFVWKGDALYTQTMEATEPSQGWTSFVLPSRDAYPLPDWVEFGSFLCHSLTFTKCLKHIQVFVNDESILTIMKNMLLPPTIVQTPKSSASSFWWKNRDTAVTSSPKGTFALASQSILESTYSITVDLQNETSTISARYVSAIAKTKIGPDMARRMERVTKKKPPKEVTVELFLNHQPSHTTKTKNRAQFITDSFSPSLGAGRIFIGFRTSQTTGLGAHLAAPFMPTVEREAMDLQDPTLRIFNLELLEFSGMVMRWTLEHSMLLIGDEWQTNATQREQHELELLKKQTTTTTTTTNEDTTTTGNDEQQDDDDDEETTKKGAAIIKFANFMARGVKKKIVSVINAVDSIVDDGSALLKPKDPIPLYDEERQAILLMRSFCPTQSTPDPLVGTALAQGFTRCLPDKTPPVITKTSGVVPGSQARLPHHGMERFVTENVIRSVVYANAQEYHDFIAECPKLNIADLAAVLSQQVLEQDQLVHFLKWWTKYCRVEPAEASTKTMFLRQHLRFCLASDEPSVVRNMADLLFYNDLEDKLQGMPLPESVIPRTLQEQVGLSVLKDSVYRAWFSPLPMEIWTEFISHHGCMNTGQPEDDRLRVKVLSTLSQEYSRRMDRHDFGQLCRSLLASRRCIPFDASEPTQFAAERPSELYLYSAELKAFDGIGRFHKASHSLKASGVSEDFLLTLGVRKSVAIDFLFENLDTLQWSDDPKPLIEYLRSATLTQQDIAKLKSTQYLPAENDVSRTFAPRELFLPNSELRIFPFVRLLQWPSEDELTQRTANGKFLVKLGMQINPSLLSCLKFISEEVKDGELRHQCLDFVVKRLGPNGTYQQEYTRMSFSQKKRLRVLPCVVKSPFDDETDEQVRSPGSCYSDEQCGIMGFPIIDPALGETAKLYGNLFLCSREPDPNTLLEQLLLLVAQAQGVLDGAKADDKEKLAARILAAFECIFQYLSSLSAKFSSSSLHLLAKESFIPCKEEKEGKAIIGWYKPNQVFFKGDDTSNALAESLFRVVEFSPFLAATGVKQEVAVKDIFSLMISSPKELLESVGGEAKYRALLRRVAADPPFSRVTAAIRDSPFLLAYTISPDGKDSTKEKSNYHLAKAGDIYIIDNSFFGRMFPVNRAPHESDLEEFYAMLGSKYISKQVEKNFQVGGAIQDTPLTSALRERLDERIPLLVSPSITSRPLVSNAASVLGEKRLEISEASKIVAVYSLGKAVSRQETTCCSRPRSGKKNTLFLTEDFDWFDVGYAIGDLILKRCQLEDAFFISSLLEAPLEQLRARGFPVDRIIKPEPLPEVVPAAPSVVPPANTGAPAARANTNVPAQPAPGAGPTKGSAGATSAPAQPEQQRSEDTAPRVPTESDGSSNKTKADIYTEILQQMFPGIDESFIRQKLGPNPTEDDVRSFAENMSKGGYPKKGSDAPSIASTDQTSSVAEPEPSPRKKKSKFGRKLGKALVGLRGSAFGGSHQMDPNTSPPGGAHQQGHVQAPSGGPNTYPEDNSRPVPPEQDATSHANMEQMLQHTVGASSRVDKRGVHSNDRVASIPEGLDRGSTCEVIPGQSLKPFSGPNGNAMTSNGIRLFSSSKHPSSEVFLQENAQVLEGFSEVLEGLCLVYGLDLSAIAIYHEPSGGTIAFNSNRALHFNVRFFFALHYMQNLHKKPECYSYWFVVMAHELAHHMVSAHNKEHGFYTESYISLYLPKLSAFLSRLQPR